MSDNMNLAPTAESPAWLLEPRQVLSAMLQRGMLMFRPCGGPYFLSDARRAIVRVFVPDTAVDFLQERGWLTRVDEEEGGEGLYLLTAEGRRAAAAPGLEPR